MKIILLEDPLDDVAEVDPLDVDLAPDPAVAGEGAVTLDLVPVAENGDIGVVQEAVLAVEGEADLAVVGVRV